MGNHRAVMNGPLGDETKMNQHLASKVTLIGGETGELDEAYKILMLGGVGVRFSGLTRELEAEVWGRIHKMVAVLFSTGQHRKGTHAVIQHTVAVKYSDSHNAYEIPDRAKMLRGLKFDEDGLLVDCNLLGCKISALPGSFSALVCTGGLNLHANYLESLPANFGELEVGGELNLRFNYLKSLPANFGELKVGGNLKLNSNGLRSLPEGFENISVGGDLYLYDNQLAEQTCTFPNVQGDVKVEEPVFDY